MQALSYIDSWIYFIFLFVFLYLINRSTNSYTIKKYGNFAFLFIYLFAVFRYNIGSDYKAYWRMVTNDMEYERTYELLSGVIINLVSYLKFPPLVFIIFSTISLVSYKKVIKEYSTVSALSWYFYFTFPPMFLQDCSTLRNAGAMACFYSAFVFMDKRKYLNAILLIFCAPLFHDTGYISFLLILLPFADKINLKLNVAIFVISFFAGRIVENMVMSYMSDFGAAEHFLSYINDDPVGLNSLQYVFYFINIINLLFYKHLIKKNVKNALMITLVNVGTCLYNVLRIEPISAIRFYCFFIFFQSLLIPYYRDIISKFFVSIKRANLALILLMFLLQIMMVFRYISVNNPDLAPYRVWFNNL